MSRENGQWSVCSLFFHSVSQSDTGSLLFRFLIGQRKNSSLTRFSMNRGSIRASVHHSPSIRERFDFFGRIEGRRKRVVAHSLFCLTISMLFQTDVITFLISDNHMVEQWDADYLSYFFHSFSDFNIIV